MSIITLNNVEINLSELGINFIPNSEQMDALQELTKFVNLDSPMTTAVLSGSAGTGKTACTKILLAYLEKAEELHYHVQLATPTHKAKAVLKRLSGVTGEDSISTMHKLLGLRPNIEIVEFDASNIDFLLEGGFLYEEMPMNRIFIFDEGGMIPDDLYDYMLDRLINQNSKNLHKIIFLGDSKQLAPVGQLEISKVFSSPDLRLNLNKVERVIDGSVILETVTELRDEPFEVFTEIKNDTSGILIYDEVKPFMVQLINRYKKAIENKSPDDVRLLCFTNKRVNQFNLAISKALGLSDLSVDGFYMGNSNYKAPYATTKRSKIYKEYLKPRGVSDPSKDYIPYPSIFNGADYILTHKQKTTIEIPQFRDMKGYYVEMFDVVEDKKIVLFMLDPEESKTNYEDLAFTIEALRLKAIDKAIPYFIRKNYWKYYYAIMDSFTSMYDLVYQNRIIRKADFIQGYALTVHRSQGSSIKEVFIDIDNVNLCKNKEMLRQLQYVACSRAKEYIHILQKK